MKKAIIGIDFGTSSVKLAVADASGVNRFISEELPDQMVRDGQVASPEAMSAFLREMLKKHKIKGRQCAIVLPASLVFTRQMTLPTMTTEQLELNLPYEFRDYITMERDKYFYDYAVIQLDHGEDGESGQMELMAAACARATIENYTNMCHWAGLKLTTVIPVEFAYLNIIRNYEAAHPETAGQERCIIDLGHTETRVYIFTGCRFEVSRVIDSCGEAVDREIADEMHIDAHLARTHKISNMNGVQELDACRRIYSEVAVDIMRAINFYSYNAPGSDLTEAWLCGGSSQIEALVAQLRSTLPIVLHPISELLEVSPALAPDATAYPAAVGITLQ